MLLVKTSFFFVFMPYICDPLFVKVENRRLKAEGVNSYDIKKTANSQ
jgi:hypothetical protein